MVQARQERATTSPKSGAHIALHMVNKNHTSFTDAARRLQMQGSKIMMSARPRTSHQLGKPEHQEGQVRSDKEQNDDGYGSILVDVELPQLLHVVDVGFQCEF